MISLKLQNINSFAIISKDSDIPAAKTALRIAKTFHNSGFDVKLVTPLKSNNFETISLDAQKLDIDCVISVGGDGTILKTARLLKKQVPILGIHMGSRGILTEIKPNEILKCIKKIKNNDFFFDKRKRISVSSKSHKSIQSLNEVYIERSTKLRAITYQITFESSVIEDRMDGLIISTPTGSTGHSLSLGSSMLSENLSALLITPIASISRIPPIAIPISNITLIVHGDTRVIVDGQIEFKVPAMEKINIHKQATGIIFLRFSDSTLRQLHRLVF